jgi:hypothetical protein
MVRSARMIMRQHPDLVEVLDLRAREMRMSRSKYIETVMMLYLATDPRNPKISNVGKIDRSLPSPLAQRDADPHRFAERWQRFVAAHIALFGNAPPSDWRDESEAFWSPTDQSPPTEDDGEAAPRSIRASPRKK